MRELQTCDFCGADPVGVYEPLPDGLVADQPRVALCTDCRDTLRRVLAPLDGGHAGAAATASDAGPDPEPESTPTDADDVTPDPDDAAGTPDSTDRAQTADATDEAVTIDASAPAEDGDATGGDGDEGDDDGDASADSGGAGDDAPRTPKKRPSGYGNVLRLVRNRDEPLSRDALEALVSSAYDMSAADVRRAIDAAVENGDLREEGGGLRPT